MYTDLNGSRQPRGIVLPTFSLGTDHLGEGNSLAVVLPAKVDPTFQASFG